MSMPRKKLAKQRSSIRRDSSLLSEAAAPFLGFIYPPLFDRPASLSSAPRAVPILMGRRLAVRFVVDHGRCGRGEGGFMKVRRNRSRGGKQQEGDDD